MIHPRRPDLRSALRDGHPLNGLFVKMPGRTSVDLAQRGGFDFAVVDLEHSLLSESDALDLCGHAAAIGLAAVVRLPEVNTGTINRVLEAGAVGVQISTLRTAAEAHALRASTRHGPDGTRSISLAHPMAAYGTIALRDHLAAEAASPPLVIGQIETATTDDPLADVLQPLDVAFLGTTDLSVDIGQPGDLAHPDVTERVAEVVRVARSSGVIVGAFASNADQVPSLHSYGARYVVAGSDIALLAAAVLESGTSLTSTTKRGTNS